MPFGEISIREYKLRFTGNRFAKMDDFDIFDDMDDRDFVCQMMREALDHGNILISQYRSLNLEVPDIEVVAFDLSGKEVFSKNIVNR